MARRDDRGYRESLTEEQRSQPGCRARELCREPRGQDTGGLLKNGVNSQKPPQIHNSRAASVRSHMNRREFLQHTFGGAAATIGMSLSPSLRAGSVRWL